MPMPLSPHPRVPRPCRTARVRLAAGALAALALLVSASADAQNTVDFNTLTVTDGSGVRYVDNCYTEGGLTFAISGVACGELAAFATWGADNPLFYTGSPALFNNSIASATVEITNSGAPFSLSSVDMTSFLGAFGNPTTVMFTGMLSAGGTVSQEFMVPGGTNALTTFAFSGFTGLSGASYTVLTPDFEPYVQIDNLMVSTVPEPATLGLVAVGLAGIGALGRRRRRAA